MRVVVYRFTGQQGPFHVPERWCEECDLTVNVVQRVASAFPGAEVAVRPWLVHLPWALLDGVWHPPGVVVDGQRVAQGAVPGEAELRAELERAAGITRPARHPYLRFHPVPVLVSLALAAAAVPALALLARAFVERFTPLTYTIHWLETVPLLVLALGFVLNGLFNERGGVFGRRIADAA